MAEVGGGLGRKLKVDVGPAVDEPAGDGEDLDLLGGRGEDFGGQRGRNLFWRAEVVDSGLVGGGNGDGDGFQGLDDVLVDDVLAVDAE